jgi:hypothetical protein
MAMNSSLKYSKNYQNEGLSNTYKQGMNSKYYTKDQFQSTNVYNSMNNSGSYNFKERAGRLKWKDIINLDIDSMIRNNDLTPLENFLENLIFSTVDENDLQIVPEPSVLKLIKTYQYTLEYLLYTQQKLENENKILETNYSQMVQDAMTKEGLLKENKSIIRSLKKEKREKEMVLNTYKCVIDEYKGGKGEQTTKNYYYCKICTGKRFSSEDALYEHHQRRHGLNNSNMSKDGHNKGKIDEKFDQMRTYFETYIKSFQNDSYLKIFENQRNLENKLDEVKYSKRGGEVNEIENNFKHTLMEMKEFLMKSTMNNQQQPGLKESNDTESKHYEETMSLLKSQAKEMNDILIQMNKAQNDKIQSVMEQLNNFKSNIADEFNVLKQQSLKKKEKKEKKKEKEFNESEDEREKAKKHERKQTPPKKVIFTAVAQAESIEFKPILKESHEIRPSSKLNSSAHLLKEHVQRQVNKFTKKQFFNAGRIETDNSDDEHSKSISFMGKGGDNSVLKSKSESPFRAKNSIVQNLENEIDQKENKRIEIKDAEPIKLRPPTPKKVVEKPVEKNEPVEVEDFDDDSNDLAMKVKVGTKLNEPNNNKIIDKRTHEQEPSN